jgi:hypothetical protein
MKNKENNLEIKVTTNALELKPLKNTKFSIAKGFSLLSGINRSIIPNQVTKLALSIKKMGAIRPVVVAKISFITGKTETYIIDGQHLFHALIRLNIAIPYVEIEIKDQKDLVEKIALLNASSRSWTMQDYIKAWGSLIPDYVKLNHYFQVYDFERNITAAILMNCSYTVASDKIKKGLFKISNEQEAVDLMDKLTDVLNIIPRMNRYENKYTCSEYIKFVKTTKNYNHSRFLRNLEKNKQKFLLATQEEGKLEEMFKKLA